MLDTDKLMKVASMLDGVDCDTDSTRLVIMCGDVEVLNMDVPIRDIKIVNEQLLPFRLKNALREVISFEQVKTKYDCIQRISASENNRYAIINWLAGRMLSILRVNAKKLYQAFRLKQTQDDTSLAELAISCRALSILDNYWVKLDTEDITWDSVNLRHNSLNNAIAQIALHGKLVSLHGSLVSPEFTTNGAYAKAWRRDEDGSLWLYKLNDMQSTAKIEVMVSNILDCTNVNHCHYEARTDMDAYVSACPAMTSDDLSIADGLTFIGYCNRLGINPDDYLMEHDKDNYYKMFIVDYLIANPDRHGQNWGITYDSKTMEIYGLHPLFDHNNAFNKDAIDNENYESFFLGKTLKQNAIMAVINGCSFEFTKPVSRDMFLTTKQYECFMHRLKQLNDISVSRLKRSLYRFDI